MHQHQQLFLPQAVQQHPAQNTNAPVRIGNPPRLKRGIDYNYLRSKWKLIVVSEQTSMQAARESRRVARAGGAPSSSLSAEQDETGHTSAQHPASAPRNRIVPIKSEHVQPSMAVSRDVEHGRIDAESVNAESVNADNFEAQTLRAGGMDVPALLATLQSENDELKRGLATAVAENEGLKRTLESAVEGLCEENEKLKRRLLTVEQHCQLSQVEPAVSTLPRAEATYFNVE